MEGHLSLDSLSLKLVPERRQTPTDLLKPSSDTTGNSGVETSEDDGSQIEEYVGQGFFETCYDEAHSNGAARCRSVRASYAREFRRNYIYGSSPCDPVYYEEKVCIWSGDSYTWKDPSSGFIWVAVHGVDSICVVTAVDAVDMSRTKGYFKDSQEIDILSMFLYSVISEIEDLADPSSQLRGRLAYLSNEKPFSVVSLVPSESDKEDQIIKNHDKMTMKFLEEKMKSRDSTSTASKTIQTAISALQHLFCYKLRADEIQCCVVKDGMEVLDFLEICDVEKHLAATKEQA